MANSSAFNRYDEIHQDLLMDYTWRSIFHYIVYQSFATIAVLCWGFTPVAALIAGRQRRLPVDGWYPYNTTITPAFEITSGHQDIAVTISCFHNIAMDMLITGLIAVACCQLAILEQNIISIDNKKNVCILQDDKGESHIEEKKILSYQQLKKCAVHSDMIYQLSIYVMIENIKAYYNFIN